MEQNYPDHYMDWEECFDTINDAIKEQGLSVAEVDYIQKPISFQKLTRRVREILDRPTLSPGSPEN